MTTLTAEQRELFRLCGQRIVDAHRRGQKFSREALADGRRWAAFKPLKGPMTSGEPGTVQGEHRDSGRVGAMQQGVA